MRNKKEHRKLSVNSIMSKDIDSRYATYELLLIRCHKKSISSTLNVYCSNQKLIRYDG